MTMELLTMVGEMALLVAVLFVLVFGIVWSIFRCADWLERKG